MEYGFLVSVAVIILSTKILGDLTKKVSMPQVVGALLAGVLIGPTGLGLIAETDFLDYTAEIGVIMLMFLAGLDTDINEIKRNSLTCLTVAGIGVIVPLIGGTVCYYFFFEAGATGFDDILKAVFVGVVLTATSVSITVEALREMGKLDGKVGNTILGAAVLDDIIGIVVLTIVSSFKDSDVSVSGVLIKILLYGICMAVLALILSKGKNIIDGNIKKQRASTYILAACLLISFASEHFFGVADITGAYLLGLFLSSHGIKHEIYRKINVPSYIFFSPIFFASVGLKVNLEGMTGTIIAFSIVLLIIAILTKIIGCGLGAKICGFSGKESVQVGVGMVSRGEVALIVAQKGSEMGLLSLTLMPAVVLVVIATTIFTPIILKKIM